MKKTLGGVLVGIVMFLAPARAAAVPINWTLSGGTFEDGTTFNGSFTYDASFNGYTAWDIAVAAGPAFTGYDYLAGVDGAFVGVHSPTAVDFVAFPPIPVSGRYIRLSFASPLTNAGGVIALLTDSSGFECNNCSIFRHITGGTVRSGAAVPEPATVTLLAGGLLASLVRRRRHAQ